MLVTCPGCSLEGELPDDGVSEGLLTCPRCHLEFLVRRPGVRPSEPSIPVETIAAGRSDPRIAGTHTITSGLDDHLSVWVGVDSAPCTSTPPPVRNLPPDTIEIDAKRPPTPPPEFFEAVTAETAAAHLDWIQAEVDRFNRFVTQQLQHIEKTRLDLTRSDSQLTAAMLTREQGLSREKATLKARAAALDRREAELAELHATLEVRVRELERREALVQQRLQEVEEIKQTLREEFEASERDVQRQRLAVEETAQNLRNRMAATPAAVATPDLIESLRSILRNLEPGPERLPGTQSVH